MILQARIAVLTAATLAMVAAYADISYKVTVPPAGEEMTIEMAIPVRAGETRLQMPNWAPGSYRLVDNAARVREFRATDRDGNALTAEKENGNTWKVASARAGTLKVSYGLPMAVVDEAVHWSGPSSYLYVVGRKEERCTLEVSAPSGWKVAVGLDEARNRTGTWVAPDYDVLADNPVTAGNVLIDMYSVSGKPHFIVLRNRAKADVDREYLKKACRFVTESQRDFFGGLPYNKYVWHFAVTDRPDGAGGLEHLSSTQISLASGVGPRAVSVIAHEFFHLWNVKRIRSRPLGPFDYTQLPQTGALWWLEGVTDYYAHHLLHRYGWWGEEMLFRDIVANVGGVRANANRLEISPHDASLRVREAANGRGNSSGLMVSYYNTGWVLGMLLDIEIRSLSGGRRSLDDVERELWRQHLRNPRVGFAEDEIRKLCIRFGGQAMGLFYDQIVMLPGELPVEAQLAKVGLILREVEETFPDYGFAWSASKSEGVRVTRVSGPSEGVLRPGDILLEINGRRLDLANPGAMASVVTAETTKSNGGPTIAVVVRREAESAPLSLSVPATEGRRKIKRVERNPEATPQQVKLREGWYWGGRKPPATLQGRT